MITVLAIVVISLPIGAPSAVPIAKVRGQTIPPILTMNVTGQSLTAGFNNTVTISLLNNYYNTAYGTGTIYDTDIAISVPSPLTLVGDNHWHYDSIVYGQRITITIKVYAPTSAIGSSVQATVTATYRQLGDISSTSESHAVSFSIYGSISIIVYGVQMTPSLVAPGGNATISGNLLNTGNLAAYNANVTVQSNILVPSSSSSAFVGEVDPNIPRPFSFLVVFKPNLANGNYSLTVIASVIDQSRPGISRTSQKEMVVQIKKPTPQPIVQRQPTGLIDIIYQILRELYNVFLGSLTGILTPIGWRIASNSHFEAAITFIDSSLHPR
jgi:hypothetical protein